MFSTRPKPKLKTNDYSPKSSASAEIKRSNLFSGEKKRPASIRGATARRDSENVSNDNISVERATILGQIHFDLAIYHYMGRFEENKDPDFESAIFHLKSSADCGLSLAEFTLACLHLNIYHDEMKELELPEGDRSEKEGLKYLESSAKHGNITAILTVANTYHSGFYGCPKNWSKAERYYLKYVDNVESWDDYSTFEPIFRIQGKRGDMYREGGYGLYKDPLKSGEIYTDAAERAMAAMNGRLANKWFMLAEEVWAECEED